MHLSACWCPCTAPPHHHQDHDVACGHCHFVVRFVTTLGLLVAASEHAASRQVQILRSHHTVRLARALDRRNTRLPTQYAFYSKELFFCACCWEHKIRAIMATDSLRVFHDELQLSSKTTGAKNMSDCHSITLHIFVKKPSGRSGQSCLFRQWHANPALPGIGISMPSSASKHSLLLYM